MLLLRERRYWSLWLVRMQKYSVAEVFYQLPGPKIVAMSFVTVGPGKKDFIPTVVSYFST